MSLRRMRRKREWKMSLRDPVFAQFSAGALNFHSKKAYFHQINSFENTHCCSYKSFTFCLLQEAGFLTI